MTTLPWRLLVGGDDVELDALREELAIPPELLEHALDPAERPRIRTTRATTFVVLRVPIETRGAAGEEVFGTAPIALVVTPRGGAVIAIQENDVVRRVRAFISKAPQHPSLRVVLTALELAAEAYLEKLDVIDARANAAEARLTRSLENREVLELLGYQRSLVFFSVALEGMYLLIERLQKTAGFHVEPEDEEWLADVVVEFRQAVDTTNLQRTVLVVVEFRQAVDTTNLQRTVLAEMMDAFASIISNNLNVVMKFLAAVTVIMTIPMIVSSMYGMNVALPGQHHVNAFAASLVASAVACVVVGAYFRRRGWL
jgi:magnesium transporter